MLKINVLSLKEDPTTFSTSIEPEMLMLDKDIQLKHNMEVALQIHRVAEKVFIQGEIIADIALVCSRCLETYDYHVREQNVFFIAVPKHFSNQRRQDENEQLQENEPAIVVYELDQLDLLPEIRNCLILAIPMKPLCSSTCYGLCMQCGEKKHGAECQCRQSMDENPFSVLKKFKLN